MVNDQKISPPSAPPAPAGPPPISVPPRPLPQNCRVCCALKWAIALIVGAGLLVCLHNPILSDTAKVWMVNAPLAKSDAIVVLGGDPNSRAFEAARLYHAGWAPVILVMSPKLEETDRLGITMSQAEEIHRILLSNSIPPEAIQIRGTNLDSTYQEAVTARAWLKETGAHSLIIPTGPFHSRRVRWVFHKILGNSARLTVRSIHPEVCGQWWRHENSLIDFQNEVIKYAYYRIAY